MATLLLGVSLAANAQQDNSGTWQWSIAGLYQDSKKMGSDAGTSLTVDGAVGIGFNIPETGRQYLVAGRLEYGRTFLVRFRDETRCFQVVNKLLLSERLVARGDPRFS